MGNDTTMAFYDSENLIYQAEDEGDEDCEVPGELTRLLQQEERTIQPHEEPVDTINLGTEDDKRGQGGCQSGTQCQGAVDSVVTQVC